MAYELKARGNERYKEGDYEGAEELYSQAYDSPFVDSISGVSGEVPTLTIPSTESRKIPMIPPSSTTARSSE